MLTATAVASVLAAASLSTQVSAATEPDTNASTAAVSAVAGSVKLRVSTSDALQLHGVLFEAMPSTSDISLYVFVYGDGISETSYQPLAMHGYRKAGTYYASVKVIDAGGQSAVSAPVTIRVRDSVPPVVRIARPRPHQRVRLGARGVLFTGSAQDSDGVTKVQLAIQLVSSAVHFKTGAGCIWYDGHKGLVLSACSDPHFFRVRAAHGQWSFRIGHQVTIPAGSYVVRVRAIDRAGNISSYYALPLRTVLPFELVR